MLRNILASVALSVMVACGACQKTPNFGPTEGPFRAKFQRPVELVSMDKTPQWSGYMYFEGILPSLTVHVEGYVNGQLRYHADVRIDRRIQGVTFPLTKQLYCESMGQPMIDPNDFFERRYQPEGPPNRGDELFDEASIPDGTVEVEFRFYEYLATNDLGRGIYLTTATTHVKLSCAGCGRCLPGQPI